jgi:hypothetical protein
LITREHRPGVGFRPALGGLGIGPWLDQNSADFLVEWLTLARPGIEVVMQTLRVGATFEEAIGLRRPEPKALASPVRPIVEAQKEPVGCP